MNTNEKTRAIVAGVSAAAVLGAGGVALANHDGGTQHDRTAAVAPAPSDTDFSQPGDPVTVVPETSSTAATDTTTEVTQAHHTVNSAPTPTETVTSTPPGGIPGHEAPKPADAQLDAQLRNHKVGDEVQYLKGGFRIRDGVKPRSGVAADAAFSREIAGGSFNDAYVVNTQDGRQLACGTERSNDPNVQDASQDRQLLCVNLEDLEGVDAQHMVEIVNATITNFDQAGDAYSNGVILGAFTGYLPN